MLTFFVIGALIGAGTGVPIGPVNVAVIDTAYRHNFRRAIGAALGGAVGDTLYALIGILGVGPLLERNPGVPPVLYAISGVVLFVYGFLTVRSPAVEAVADAVHPHDEDEEPLSGNMWSGFWLGFLLIVLNPAAIVTWVLIVGSFMSGVDNFQGLAASIGVGVGSFAWFSFVAYLAHHGKRILGAKAIWITRVVGILLIVYSFYSIYRALAYWLS